MRKFNPQDEHEKSAMSQVLHSILNEVSKKCRGFTAMEFSRRHNLQPSELTRMKLFFRNQEAKDASSICILKMQAVLAALFKLFPALKIWEKKNGEFKAVLRLDKMRGKKVQPFKYADGKIVYPPLGRPRKQAKMEASGTRISSRV